jgi:DNA-binding transcriptional ArsR family regulator
MKASLKKRIPKDKLEKAAYILKTIGHPTRLAIIELLAPNKEMSVSEIYEELEVEQSVVSHHLLNMKVKGLLSSKKEGTNIYYSLKEKNLIELIACVGKCDCNM